MIFTTIWIGIMSKPEVAFFNAQSFKDTLAGFQDISDEVTAFEFYKHTLPDVFYDNKDKIDQLIK